MTPVEKESLCKGAQLKATKNGWKRNIKDTFHECLQYMRKGEVFTIISEHLDGVMSQEEHSFNVESKGQVYRITHDELYDYELL